MHKYLHPAIIWDNSKKVLSEQTFYHRAEFKITSSLLLNEGYILPALISDYVSSFPIFLSTLILLSFQLFTNFVFSTGDCYFSVFFFFKSPSNSLSATISFAAVICFIRRKQVNLKFNYILVLGSSRVCICAIYRLSELGKQMKIKSLKIVH